MPGRRFATSTVTIERATNTNATGTLQKITTYSAVSGLTGIEAAIKETSVTKTDIALVGDVANRMVIVDIDADLIPVGAVVKVGDRIHDTVLDKTYTVLEVLLVDNRAWQIRAHYKAA